VFNPFTIVNEHTPIQHTDFPRHGYIWIFGYKVAVSREIYIPPGGPPRIPKPSDDIFSAMGEKGVFGMLADFYRRLGQSQIRHLFPDGEEALVEASRKSAAFFVQIIGGPPLFSQTYGAPKMRERHLPFEIDAAAREEWLRCFGEILAVAPERYGFPPEHLPGFRTWLEGFSAWMVNK